jgi:hypothetical protein
MKKVKFFTDQKTLLEFPELYPQPARNFIPEWFKKMPINDDEETKAQDAPKIISGHRTAKTCPSFVEIFNEGFVSVSPCDVWLRVRPDGTWAWKTPTDSFSMEIHEQFQFVKYAPKEANVKAVFKYVSPWYAVTPKGYSLRQIPLEYHYNKDFYVPYGVLKADKHFVINQQIFVTSDKDEILIKRGQPLSYLVPYKREKFGLEIESFDTYKNKREKELRKQSMYISSSFRSNYHKFNS